MKTVFRKKCKNFFIEEKSKRLYQYRYLNSLFDSKQFSIKSLILLQDKIEKIINLFLCKLDYIGLNRLMYEIERRGIYTNNLKENISKLLKNCFIFIENKLNKFIKPANIHIISKKPLERVQIDIAYFKNKLNLNVKELENKYLLNLMDYFSKFSQGYILNNKTSKK